MENARLSRGEDVSGISQMLVTLVQLSLATLLPTLIFYVFATSSQAPGVGAVALGFMVFALIGVAARPPGGAIINASTLVAVIAFVLFTHLLAASLLYPVQFSRASGSLALLSVVLVGAYVAGFSLFDQSNYVTDRAVGILTAVFFAIGLLAILGIQPLDAPGAARPVFPFTEPSHYALTFTPLLLAFCVPRAFSIRLAAILAAMTIAYLLQSLSLVVGTVFIAFVCLPVPMLAAGSVVFAAAVAYLDISYFADRLDLNYDSGNLSVLVYIQGWELVADSLKRSSFWGIGFQQLGFGPINSPTADLVYRLAGNDANIKDGGFTLAKIVSEFGGFGILLIAAYATLAVPCSYMLRRRAMGQARFHSGLVLAYAAVSAYLIEAFVRGIGYFSGSTFLMIAASTYCYRHFKSNTSKSLRSAF
jgi:hypothetical protein